MHDFIRTNLLRLLAARAWSIDELCLRAELDRRTLQGILNGTHRPHARTVHRLAQGLDVHTDELFLDPSRLLYRCFDRQTNPVVEQVVETHPEVFSDWCEADFDELHSHVGAGGALTEEGTLAAAGRLNLRREMTDKLALVLECAEADLVVGFLNLAYERATRLLPPRPAASSYRQPRTWPARSPIDRG